MRFLHYFPIIICVLSLWNCRDESDELVPKSPTIKAVRDSASIHTSESDTLHVDSVATLSDTANAEQPKKTSSTKSGLVFTDSAIYQRASFDDMRYRVLTPLGFKENKKYPLVIFLHGIDERGTDNEKQLKWGASLFASENEREAHPAFVIFPQCPVDYRWRDAEPMNKLKLLVDDFVAKYNIDINRIYIAGLSMGAYGTYEIVARNPGFFAAAIAISGDGDENRIENLAKTQWRIYGGGKDTVVPASKSEHMAKLLKEFGAKVSVKIYPEANHLGSWLNAFEEPDFTNWMFSVSK